jgi:hypothetical protein
MIALSTLTLLRNTEQLAANHDPALVGQQAGIPDLLPGTRRHVRARDLVTPTGGRKEVASLGRLQLAGAQQ